MLRHAKQNANFFFCFFCATFQVSSSRRLYTEGVFPHIVEESKEDASHVEIQKNDDPMIDEGLGFEVQGPIFDVQNKTIDAEKTVWENIAHPRIFFSIRPALDEVTSKTSTENKTLFLLPPPQLPIALSPPLHSTPKTRPAATEFEAAASSIVVLPSPTTHQWDSIERTTTISDSMKRIAGEAKPVNLNDTTKKNNWTHMDHVQNAVGKNNTSSMFGVGRGVVRESDLTTTTTAQSPTIVSFEEYLESNRELVSRRFCSWQALNVVLLVWSIVATVLWLGLIAVRLFVFLERPQKGQQQQQKAKLIRKRRAYKNAGFWATGPVQSPFADSFTFVPRVLARRSRRWRADRANHQFIRPHCPQSSGSSADDDSESLQRPTNVSVIGGGGQLPSGFAQNDPRRRTRLDTTKTTPAAPGVSFSSQPFVIFA